MSMERREIVVAVTYKLALSILAGMIVGAIAPPALHAQTRPAPAYLIGEIQVHNAETYKKYASQVPATLAPFGGHYLAAGGEAKAVEGDPPAGRIVIIEFPSLEKALQFEKSPAYEKIKPIRHANATSRIFIVQGLPSSR
jgi:uncharacterized protein (DUF1330 family)